MPKSTPRPKQSAARPVPAAASRARARAQAGIRTPAAPAAPARDRGKPKAGASPGAADSLPAIQRAITGALFRPLGRDDAMQKQNAAVAERIIKPNDRLTSFERLEIYNQQYWWRLLGAFADDFPGVHAVLGTRKFDSLALAYLQECGSASWSLRDLGQHLVSFIERHPEYTAPHTALARDMARLEWAKTLCFDATEFPPIDPQQLATRPAHRLKLGLQPYIVLLRLDYPVDQLVSRMHTTSSETASNAVSAGSASAPRRATQLLRAKPSREPIHLAVHRSGFSVYYKRIEPEAHHILAALRDGSTLADACEQAFANSPNAAEAPTKIGQWFQAWTTYGWLTPRKGK